MKIYDIRNKTQTPINEGLFDMFGSDPNVHAPSREQKKQTKEREKGTKKLIDRAFDSWRDHLDQVKATLPDQYKGEIPPERVKADLQTFIQNNIMGGGQISQAANAADITHYIDKLSGVESAQEEPIGQAKTDNFAGVKSGKGTTAATSTTSAPSTGEQPATEPAGEEPAAEPTEPQQEPILKDPNVSKTGVQRIQKATAAGEPTILKRNNKEYSFDPDQEAYPPQWMRTDLDTAKPVNDTLNKLLNDAYEEFIQNDDILSGATTPSNGGQGQAAPAQQPTTPPTTEPGGVEPFQIGPKESGVEALKRYKNYLADLKANRQLSGQQADAMFKAAAQQEFELRSQTPLEKPSYPAPKEQPVEPGEEPASQGLRRVPGSTGRGMQAQFEPIKESLRRRISDGELSLTEAKKIYHSEKLRLVREAAEKLGIAKERELFGKLVRAALLSRSPTSSGVQRPAQTPQPRTSGSQQLNQPQTQAAFELTRGQKKEIDKILGDLEDKGHDIRKITKESDSVNSTGNAAADAALRALGFNVA